MISNNNKKIGVLTSSRADYGIYKSLISKIKNDTRFKLTIIAFGMHLKKKYGNTIDLIKKDNYERIDIVKGMPDNDTPLAISKGYGNLIKYFSIYWETNKFDTVLCLGDRFEMSAAVQAGIPFNINFAHFHGGEITLGAIDNIYRHQISLCSSIHFTTHKVFYEKLVSIMGNNKNIYNFGSLSIENIEGSNISNWDDVRNQFKIPNKEFILVTFHPETTNINRNNKFCKIIYNVLERISKEIHIVVTLSNADTMNGIYKKTMYKLNKHFPSHFTLVDNFGKENYFSVINRSKFLIGNTSSGILEAASFKKYVLNVGERQKGRFKGDNVYDVPFNEELIYEKYLYISKLGIYKKKNIFYKKNTSDKIIEVLASV